MYAFTYASVNIPSLLEAQYHSHLVLYVRVQFYRWITYRACVAELMKMVAVVPKDNVYKDGNRLGST